MIIKTVKFSKKRALCILLTIAVVIAAVILAVPEKKAEAASVAIKPAGSEEGRVAYIESLGYEVGGEPVVSREVVIPQVFDDVYTNYNALQLECGFDLAAYKGRQVELYTYPLSSYPGFDGEVMCDLLVLGGEVIGGNIYTAALNGFMHGLRAYQG